MPAAMVKIQNMIELQQEGFLSFFLFPFFPLSTFFFLRRAGGTKKQKMIVVGGGGGWWWW
jgi:hypothetical protein